MADIRERLQAAEIRAIEAHDYAGAYMLGELREDWNAGQLPLVSAEFALAGARARADRLEQGDPS